MKPAIKLDEWLAAQAAVKQDSGGEGFTTYELSNQLGISQCMVQNQLRALFRAGHARRVGHRWSTAMSGKRVPVPAYVLVKPKK